MARPLLLALGALALGACRTDGPEALYREALEDYAGREGAGGLEAAVLERQDARFEKARAWIAGGELETSDDLVWTAALLVTSDHQPDLELAHELAWAAAEQGDARGRQLAAEAIDKLHLSVGLPQVYGTQYVLEPASGRWRLYAVDPGTTDEQRELMGIAPLAALQARADELNRAAAPPLPSPIER